MTSVTFTARNIQQPGDTATQCAVVPMFKGRKSLSGVARELDRSTGGAIRQALSLGDFNGGKGDTLLLHGNGKIKRLLLVGCGKEDEFDRDAAMKFCHTLAKRLDTGKASEATLHISPLKMKKKDYPWLLGYLARLLVTTSYRYTETLSEPGPDMHLTRLVVNTEGATSPGEARTALATGRGIGTGVNEARNLANLPGNICTPGYLARQARKLARGESKFSVNVLEEKRMRELGMGALLSVSAGSAQPAKLIVVQYKGARASDQPYVLVGKGITFDSGGISIKPGAKMDEMKFDMGGAASVMGVLRALKELQLPVNVVGIIAAAENMPSGTATKPGDVVTSMSGKTIEILNTDAEGRLVLCDALTYAARFKPRAVIDIATLTGACVVALGSHASAVYSKNDELAGQLLEAGIETHDRAWRMPLWDDYQKQLKSNFADMANIGGPGGGSITAACFLARFTEDYDWAHFDIAGSAWDSMPKGATGRPVPLLVQYLMDRAGQ